MRKRVYCLLVLSLFICGAQAASGQDRDIESTEGRLVGERALDPELTNYPYPFPVRFYEVETQGQKLRMAYLDMASAKPNGRTVVLLHGKNFSAAYWAETIKPLLAEGYRVVAPDQIGFGKSSKPASYQFSFQALAANTRSLLDSLRVGKFVLVGHSMGGMLAVRMALMYPERVERLVLVNPIGLEDWKLVAPYRTVDENFAQELRATPESIKEYQRVNYFGGEWKPEYNALTEILAGWTRHPEYRRVAWNAALTSDMVFTQPVLYEFDRVRTPTLLIIGQRDRTAIGKDRLPKEVAARMGDYPTLGKAAARRIPGARLFEIAEAGHLPQVESFPKYIRALLDFISAG
ncbi:MAG TPA: alpha/beta hydrolase [Pyrinomonadaceae bacterium]|nr:alpha/beta hydrolase [Pyrinomonadaceae bacterium]